MLLCFLPKRQPALIGSIKQRIAMKNQEYNLSSSFVKYYWTVMNKKRHSPSFASIFSKCWAVTSSALPHIWQSSSASSPLNTCLSIIQDKWLLNSNAPVETVPGRVQRSERVQPRSPLSYWSVSQWSAPCEHDQQSQHRHQHTNATPKLVDLQAWNLLPSETPFRWPEQQRHRMHFHLAS